MVWLATALFLCAFSACSAQIENSGSISWVRFDNITIQAPTYRSYHLWTMPNLDNWTGLIGLSVDTSNSFGYFDQVSFTGAVNTIAPSFDDQSHVMADWNSYVVYDDIGIQLPANGGNGNDSWSFLFQAISQPPWTGNLTVGVFIIEMETINENATSPAIMINKGQIFLYKIIAKEKEFSFGDTVQVTLSKSCNMKVAVGFGKIPSIYDAVDYYQYIFISENATALYYVVQVQEDCSSLTININRISPAISISLGDEISQKNWDFNSFMLIRLEEPATGIQIQLNSPFDGFQQQVYANTDNFGEKYSFNFALNSAINQNNTVWNLYSSSLKSYTWYFYFSGSYYPGNYTFLAIQSQVDFNVTQQVQRDTKGGFCAAQSSGSPSTTYTMPQESSCVCIMTNWGNIDYAQSYPPNPSQSNLGVTPNYFPDPFNPDDNNFNFLCLVRPPTIISNILATLNNSFSQTDERVQNITFFDVPQFELAYGETQIILADDLLSSSNSIFFTRVSGQSKGAIIVNTTCDSVEITPDDWSQSWLSVSSTVTLSLYTSSSNSSGWLALGQTTNDCYFSIISVEPVAIPLSSSVPTTTVTLTYFQNDDDSFVSLIHVTTPQPTVGVFLNFSSEVDEIIAQSGIVPNMNVQKAYDPLGRYPMDQYSVSSLLVPALGAHAGVISTDFFALVFSDSDSPPTISVTASIISTSTYVNNNNTNNKKNNNKNKNNSDTFTIAIPNSPLPQIVRIPYQKDLQVLSAEFQFSESSCILDNYTMCVFFGAGGLQTTLSNYMNIRYGLPVSPLRNYFYAGNQSADYYVLVNPDTSSFNITIRPEYSEYLCDPVLLCNGHGSCSVDHTGGACSCLSGGGFSFHGTFCDKKDFHLVGVYLIIFIFLFYFSIKATEYVLRRRLMKSAAGENTPLLHKMDSEAIRNYLMPTNLALDNVELVVGTATLLKGVNLLMRSGELTAVIGPSGAGKSTIMKVLSGRVKPTTGTIRINGTEIPNLNIYRSLIGYVPQDDVMNPLLTVHENIKHSALMRLPSDMSYAEKLRLTDTVIDALGLTAKRNTVVGDLGGQSSLSGGQRKRVSIGMELVICPSILLLDEPTSGLDSKTALSLVHLLKTQVAPMGINIISVVHQPRYEILNACDNIMILAAGELKYFGKPTIAELSLSFPRLQDTSTLNGVNIADLLIDYIEELNWPGFKHNSEESINCTPSEELKPRKLPSFAKQLYLLTKRAFQQIFRDSRSLLILFVLVLLSAFLIGALYHGSEFIGPPSEETISKCPSGFQFLCAQNQKDSYMAQGLLICLSLGLTAGSSSLSLFGGTEKLVFARECSSGQSNFAYYLAKMISVIPNQVLAPLLFVSIIHLLTQPVAEFWHVFIVGLGIYEVCINIAILSSILLADSRALTVSVVAICICNVLSGENPTLLDLRHSLGGVLGRALPALSYSRWGIEAFYVSLIQNYNSIYNLSISLSMWDYSLSDLSLAFGIPFAIGFVLRICCAIIVTRKH